MNPFGILSNENESYFSFVEVNCVLRHYIKEGAVTVLPWNLNMVSQREIRTEGLFAALNDCLYRNMNDFKYLMLIDFDEFIIPHTNDTLPEMLKYLEQQKVVLAGRRVSSKKTSSYSFQNAFFYLQFPGTGILLSLWFLMFRNERSFETIVFFYQETLNFIFTKPRLN